MSMRDNNPFAPLEVPFDIGSWLEAMGIPFTEVEFRPREFVSEVVEIAPMEVPDGLTAFIDFAYAKTPEGTE